MILIPMTVLALGGQGPDAEHDVKISGTENGDIKAERVPHPLEGAAELHAQSVESAGNALLTYAAALRSRDARRINVAEVVLAPAIEHMYQRARELNGA